MLEMRNHVSWMLCHYKIETKIRATITSWLHEYKYSKTACENDGNDNEKIVQSISPETIGSSLICNTFFFTCNYKMTPYFLMKIKVKNSCLMLEEIQYS
jgi:hypothetical protein